MPVFAGMQLNQVVELILLVSDAQGESLYDEQVSVHEFEFEQHVVLHVVGVALVLATVLIDDNLGLLAGVRIDFLQGVHQFGVVLLELLQGLLLFAENVHFIAVSEVKLCILDA